MEELFTFKSMLTFGGAAAASAAVTQILKPLFEKLPFEISPRVVSYVIALTVTVTATAFSGSREPADYFMCIVNAALISLSSNGGYDLIKTLINKGEEDNNENNS